MRYLLFLPSVAFAQVQPIEITPIPEPGTLWLLAAVAVVFLFRYAHKSK